MVIKMVKFCDKLEFRLSGLVCVAVRIEWWCVCGSLRIEWGVCGN